MSDPAAAGGVDAVPWAAPSLIAVIFINMLGFGIIVPLLPFYAKSIDAAPWQISLIFSAYAMGGFFGEPFWGRLSDRYGRKPLLISTITGNCLCYLALAFAPNVLAAFVIRFLGGLVSGNGAVIQGYIADVTPPEKRARMMSRQGAAWNVGMIVGPGGRRRFRPHRRWARSASASRCSSPRGCRRWRWPRSSCSSARAGCATSRSATGPAAGRRSARRCAIR